NAAATPPVAAQLDAIRRLTTRGGTVQLRSRQLETMKVSFPQPVTTGGISAGAWAQVAGPALGVYIPKATLCHGSVVAVPLGGSNTAPVPIKNENVKLYENVKRAMADIAAKTGNADQVNAVEMLLANLESQKYSTGGILDMPGAAHAATFQSVPGKPTRYARIDVEAKASTAVRAPNFGIIASDMLSARGATGYWPMMQTRSASVQKASRISKIPGLTVRQPAQPAQPQGPTQAQKDA